MVKKLHIVIASKEVLKLVLIPPFSFDNFNTFEREVLKLVLIPLLALMELLHKEVVV